MACKHKTQREIDATFLYNLFIKMQSHVHNFARITINNRKSLSQFRAQKAETRVDCGNGVIDHG